MKKRSIDKNAFSWNRRIFLPQSILMPIFFLMLLAPSVSSHSIHYDVQQKGLAVRIFYSERDPASYSQYELFGPGDAEPHQVGRTDRNGFLSFFPDRAGTWKIKVWGESSHGYHGAMVDVKVDEALNLQSFSKPLAATHTKLIIGVSLIFGLFGIYALLKTRAKGQKNKS